MACVKFPISFSAWFSLGAPWIQGLDVNFHGTWMFYSHYWGTLVLFLEVLLSGNGEFKKVFKSMEIISTPQELSGVFLCVLFYDLASWTSATNQSFLDFEGFIEIKVSCSEIFLILKNNILTNVDFMLTHFTCQNYTDKIPRNFINPCFLLINQVGV